MAKYTIDTVTDTDPAPFYCRYPMQCEAQRVYVEVDWRDNSISVGYNPEVGNGMPAYVWDGEATRYYGLPHAISAAGAEQAMQDVAEVLEKHIRDEYEDEKAEASDKLSVELIITGMLGSDYCDMCDTIGDEDWYWDYLNEKITAGTTDEMIKELVEELEEEAVTDRTLITCNLDEMAKNMRDEKLEEIDD